MNNINARLSEHFIVPTKSKSNKKNISVEQLICGRHTRVCLHTQKVNLVLLKHLKIFSGRILKINDIDSKFCYSFANYLINNVGVKISSATTYMQKLHAILQEAFYLGYIQYNPMPPINKLLPKYIPQERACLTVSEIKKLEKAKCKHELTKKAFLFSCYTGLRLSDIETLKWEHIRKQDNYYMLVKIQIKTNSEVRVPLSKQAIEILKWIKEYKQYKGDFIFPLYSRTITYSDLKNWAKNAKIEKHITFHVSRVTFVTLSISAGTNLYVVSKLCGHKDIKTTQIYARIINKTYIDAIANLEHILLSDKKNNKKNVLKVDLLV